MPAEFRPRALLAHLTAHGVDFVVIGGIAAVLHGSDRNTFDLDVCPAQDAANLDVLGKALVEIGATLCGVGEEVPLVPDGRSLRGMEIATLDTDFGPLDVLARPDGSPPYSSLRKRATRLDIGPAAVLVASVGDLIAMKKAAGRDKDNVDIATLEAILRSERGRRAT